LFKTSHNTIKEFLFDLTYEDIRENFYSVIFHRGLEYYERGLVQEILLSGRTRLEARVLGSARYNVTLELKGNYVTGQCSCPYSDNCKHMVAALLSGIESPTELDEVDDVAGTTGADRTNDYLNKLSKKELIKLVLEYAPESFKYRIISKAAGKEESEKLLNKVERELQALFKYDELFYDPGAFEQALVVQLEKLSGVWEKLPEATGELILEILDKIDRLQDEGYLYDDYHDDCFYGDDISEKIREYMASLAFGQRLDFLKQLRRVLSNMSYEICSGVLSKPEELFTENDLPALKEYLLTEVQLKRYGDVANYFKLVSGYLSETEKEVMLTAAWRTSDSITLELTEFYKKSDKLQRAIETLKEYLEANAERYFNKEPLYAELLRLQHAVGIPDLKIAIGAMESVPTISMLEGAIACLPDQREQLENILKEKDSHEYLEYLQSCQRIQEAVTFINRNTGLWDEVKFRFFVKHKKQCPKEAASYFARRIQTELRHTGNSHYYAIADTLRAFKQIDAAKATDTAQNIRAEYKRRRNLMQAIEGV